MDPMNEELPGRLAAAVRALDARSRERSSHVSAERVAAGVLERLRREGLVERSWWMRPAALRIAAAAVLVVAAGGTVSLVRQHSAQTAAQLPVAIPAMDSLTAGELEAVLQAAGQVRAANFGPVGPSNGSLDSLSEQQLQKVLASL